MTRTCACAVVAALAGACAGSNSHGVTDGNNGGDAPPPPCTVSLVFTPPNPVAGPISTVRASAVVDGAGGVLAYTWSVAQGGNNIGFAFAAVDQSQIDFTATTAGVYDVRVDVAAAALCPTALVHLNVAAPGANLADYRLRVVPGPTVAPPQETIIEIHGGADYNRTVQVDTGIVASGEVHDQTSTGIPAYVRFIPVAAPNAIVETFSSTTGAFSVRVLGQPHDVLVVPAVPGLAPKRIASWMPGTTLLSVDPGTAITGSVRGPGGVAPLANAKVQLEINGTPSTLTTTAADGSFTVLAQSIGNANVSVHVVPPPDSGMPRLDATSSGFNLALPVQIQYGAQIATCDVGGAIVKRNATALAGARAIVVGTIATAGTVVTGGASANATGTVRIVAIADAGGRLPSTLAPKAALQAVVEVGSGDVATAALDLTGACANQTINAAAMVVATATVRDRNNVALAGVRVEATPTAALAIAGEPPLATTTDASGTFTLLFASGGLYDLRGADPAGRGAATTLLGRSAGTLPPTIQLARALHVTGTVTLTGNPNPIAGAAVQLLCTSCSGLDITRAIAETATDELGRFGIAVLDPGTM